MPHLRLTQAAVERVNPPSQDRVIHWDTTLPSFGLRVSARGKRTWVCSYRVREGRQIQETRPFATCPSVAEAREWARGLMAAADRGENPVEVRRELRRQEKTIAEAVADYLSHVDNTTRPKTAAEVRRIFHYDVVPAWGETPLKQITKQHVNDMIDAKATKRDRPRKGFEKGAFAQSNRMLAWLKHFFSWAQSHELIDNNPAQGVMKRAKEVTRDRVLSDDELIKFWISCGRMSSAYAPLFKVLLLTAQRKEEVAGMRWTEIDLAKQLWTIPASRCKNGKAHDVHLSDMAVDVLTALPRIAGSDFVFSSGRSPRLNGFGKAKAQLDQLSGIADHWVLHDLRRSATTGMARLGVRAEVADAVLNHTSGTVRGVAAIYNRFTYGPERKAALEAWSRHVGMLVEPEKTTNVVALVRA